MKKEQAVGVPAPIGCAAVHAHKASQLLWLFFDIKSAFLAPSLDCIPHGGHRVIVKWRGLIDVLAAFLILQPFPRLNLFTGLHAGWMDVYLSIFQPPNLSGHRALLFLDRVCSKARHTKCFDQGRGCGVAPHEQVFWQCHVLCLFDDLLFGQFPDCQLCTNVKLSVFPSAEQNDCEVVIAPVKAHGHDVECVLACWEIVNLEVIDNQATQFAPVAYILLRMNRFRSLSHGFP